MNVYLFQPQNAIDSGDQKNYWLPYSAACLWSYARQYKDIRNHFELKNIFFKRELHDTVLKKMEKPSLVGFSCYIWNENYCLNLAKKIKNKWPDCVVLFGGEQVSKKHYEKYDFVDAIVLNEGEQAFVDILHRLMNQDKIPFVSCFPRLKNLDIPSPYLDGTMDIVTKNNPTTVWATTVESNRGCPYSCTFCDWGGAIQSKVKKFSLEKIQAELEWVKNNRVAYLFFADANFGIFKERDIAIAEMIRKAADESVIEAVNLQYAKNNTESVFEIGKILGPFNRGITVSVQSMNPDTLKAIKRTNLEVNDIAKVMKLSEKYNVNTYTEMILGLPLETVESWKNGITELLELGQHQSIDFNLAEVLENSELNESIYKEKYKIKTKKLDQYYTLKQDEYPEPGCVISETSTMNSDDLAEAYMYAWIIVHCHINGYTQLYAKYARFLWGISYRKFYDEFLKELYENKKIKKHYKTLKQKFKKYLITGKLDESNEKGDSLHFSSHKFCYNERNYIFDIGKKVLENFELDTNDIEILQKNYIYDLDNSSQYPKIIECSLDTANWKFRPTKYIITNDIIDYKNNPNLPKGVAANYERLNFWFMRRKNLLKNKLSIV